MKKVSSLLFLIALASPLFGQQAVFRPGGFSFITPFQASISQDNNFLIDRTDPKQKLFFLSLPPSVLFGSPVAPTTASDQVLTLTMPTLTYEKGGRRYELVGTYMPEFEIFRQNTDQNAFNHVASADFTYIPTRRMRFVIADTYYGSEDAGRTLRNPFLFLPRSAFRENAVRGDFQLELTPRTALNVEYNSILTTYGLTDPFTSRILDTVTHGVTVTARRMVSRKQRVTASYSVFTLRPINQLGPANTTVDADLARHPIHAFKGDYRYSFSASSVLELSGGVSYLDNSTNYLMRVGGYRRLGAFWVGGSYGRELSVLARPGGLPDGIGPGNYYDLATVRVIGQPTRNIGVQTEFVGALNASRRVFNGGKSLLSRTRFDYRLSDRTVAFASVETFHQPLNDYIHAPLSRNRFTVGFEFSLSSEADRRLDPRNLDEQYVALTDHNRRRQLPE